MIHFQKSGIEEYTPEGKLTLWGAYQYPQSYIHENYGWLADSTTEGHQNRLREIIENIIPIMILPQLTSIRRITLQKWKRE